MLNKDELQEMLNEGYPPVQIADRGYYYHGDILRALDPIAFDEAYDEYCDNYDALEVDE
jgi:hypothetical protein